MFHRLKSQIGVTLVELTLTLTLVGILGVAAVALDPGSQALNIDAAAHKLQSDLRYAQNMAITTGVEHGLRVTTATTYEIYNASTGTIIESPYTHMPLSVDLTQDYLGASFADADVNADILFSNFGEPLIGGGEILQLQGTGASKQIQVSPNSGFVSIL